jgi:hypothetical protein
MRTPDIEMRAARSAALLVLAAFGMAGVSPATEAREPARLEILFPTDGTVVAESACGVLVAGVSRNPRRPIDVIIAIDTSRSTVEASGADIDGDGVLGRPDLDERWAGYPAPATDPMDSILAAEVEAARRLLEGLDFSVDRAGIVTFSGARRSLAFWRRSEAARSVLELTRDEDRIDAALETILLSEPHGGTNLAAAVDRIVTAFGDRSERSERNPTSRAVAYLFTDGQPTLPMGAAHVSENVRASLDAIDRAAAFGVQIDSFGIGREALEGPIVPVEMAARTGGEFTPVRHPGDLVDVIDNPSRAKFDGVAVRNTTTDRIARDLIARPDGSWAALVDLEEGENRIEVTATRHGADPEVHSVVVLNDAIKEPTPIPETLQAKHRELLEDCLRRETGKRLTLEAEVRDRLVQEIERERRRALERSREQRKHLELDVETPVSPDQPPDSHP